MNKSTLEGFSNLFFRAAEHGHNTEADGMNWEGWRPILRKDRQANVTVAVDVRVHRNLGAHKSYLKIFRSE